MLQTLDIYTSVNSSNHKIFVDHSYCKLLKQRKWSSVHLWHLQGGMIAIVVKWNFFGKIRPCLITVSKYDMDATVTSVYLCISSKWPSFRWMLQSSTDKLTPGDLQKIKSFWFLQIPQWHLLLYLIKNMTSRKAPINTSNNLVTLMAQ